jgi:formylglycine-generating enzyme required for sulfatase activity
MRIGRVVAIVAVAGAPAVAGACGAFGAGDTTLADASTDALAAAEGGEGSAGDGGRGCPGGEGPRMVLVTAGDLTFCIDATEVTRAQYPQFLDTGPTASKQAAVCAWNKTFAPATPLTGTSADLPMIGVDWCDAYAFCAWAGKRLCGGHDGAPLSVNASALKDPQQSEWMAACSLNGSRKYPYGGTAISGACNTENDAGLVTVGERAGCEGGYAGLFDMVGNVTEWENACDDSARAGDAGGRCTDRGGSYKQGGDCTFASFDRVSGFSSDWGIRCCATPQP